ncbi:MAG: wax ester/triacylglycerol synthase family O-acyltransferase [Xanthomonadales bacterium]|nr:wax ester/triacylglycerol synthase family O-acyltransferase [Xanthomonadales bacterium]
MRKLSAMDLAFFIAETEDSPKHVAGLMLFKKPRNSRANFGRKLVEELKTHQQLTEPFNLVIRLTGLTGPGWQPCSRFDIEQHVFYHRTAKTCSWKEARELAARLHEPLMDRSRPLWEYHLIDNIEKARFAVYFKVHHAYADGMTMTTWLNKSLNPSAGDLHLRPPWTMPVSGGAREKKNSFSLSRSVQALSDLTWGQALTAGGLARLGAQQMLERTGLTRKNVSLQFNTAHETPLTGSATSGRGIATTFVPMDDVKAVCKATRCTLNHVALACIDGALHRYLEETGHAVDHPITIQMPVNLRTGDDSGTGNKVGVALVELASPTEDPFRRLQEIGHSLHKVKQQVANVRGEAMQQYTVIPARAGELIEKMKLSDRIPTNGYTLVSNVPGPAHALYMKGAKLEQMYPISILVPGLRMNITLLSCAGVLNFGIVATEDVKSLDRLASHIREEFDLLQGLT